MITPLAKKLGLTMPVFAFSKAPAVVAAVSRAGGMGVLGAVAYTPDQLREALDYIEAHCDGKPYGVDVVMPEVYVKPGDNVEAHIPPEHRAFVDRLLREFGVPELPAGEAAWHSLLGWTEETVRPQLEIIFQYPIKLLANALGTPPKDIIDRAHDNGILVAALAGSVRHAQRQIAQGIDVVVAQGTEAGGHCGEIATMVLVPDVVDAVGQIDGQPVKEVAVLAAGGIGTGRQMAAALALGAQGVWLGSLWLTCAESDVNAEVLDKLLSAGSGDTVRSKALSGKPARQLKTAWSDAWDNPKNPTPLLVPLQFVLTAEATTRIHRFASDSTTRTKELLTSPVGQIVGRMNQVEPVSVIMDRLRAEYETALSRVNGYGQF